MTIAIIDVETTGLDPLNSRLVAIGIGHKDEIKIITNDDEEQMLNEFWGFVNVNAIDKIVGFNVGFDWLFLKLRSLKYGLKIKHFANYTGRIDLRTILNGNKYAKGKLTDYCKFFELDVPEDDLKGDAVPTLWEQYTMGDNNALEEIKKHLGYDIERTLKLYELIKNCGLIE